MCLRHNSSAAECSWHASVLLHSHNKQNQQGKNLSFFWGRFPAVWFMIDALRQCLKLMPLMWCGADVCVLWGEHFFVWLIFMSFSVTVASRLWLIRVPPQTLNIRACIVFAVCTGTMMLTSCLVSILPTKTTVWKPPVNKEKKKIETMYMNCLLSFLRAWHLYLQSFLNAARRFTLLFPFCHTLFFFITRWPVKLLYCSALKYTSQHTKTYLNYSVLLLIFNNFSHNNF